MSVTPHEVEQGAVKQPQEKTLLDGSNLSQEEDVSGEVPTKDIVTPKTWLVVFVSVPCPRSAMS